MAIHIRLFKNNVKSGKSFGKWFGRTTSMQEIHTSQLAEIIERRCSFTRGDVEGIIIELVEVMREQLQSGNTVVLDKFGRFRLTVETEGVEHPKDFNLKQNIKRIRCSFLPYRRRNSTDHILEEIFSTGTLVEMLDEYESPKRKQNE